MRTGASSSGQWSYAPSPWNLQAVLQSSLRQLVDFIVEWTDLSMPASQGPDEYWKMYFDGVGAGVLFVSPSKEQLRYVLRIYFPASNNAAEYEACLHGL